MSPARAAALVLCGLIAAAGLAGCDLGGDAANEPASPEDYVTEAQRVSASIGDSVAQISEQISRIDKLDLASAGDLLATFSDRVDDLADKLGDISPPESVAALHERLVGLLDELGDRAEQAAIALKAGDLLGGLPALAGFAAKAADIGGKVDSTVGQIKEKLGVQ